MPRPNAPHRQAPCGKVAPNWKTPENEWASRLRSSVQWQRLRALVLSRRPLCCLCGNLADQVHHIDPHDRSLFFEPANLAPVCEECHGKVNSAYHRGIAPGVLFPVETRITSEELA